MDIPLRFHVSIGAGERKTHKVNEVKLLLLPLRLLSSRQTKLLYAYTVFILFLYFFKLFLPCELNDLQRIPLSLSLRLELAFKTNEMSHSRRIVSYI